MFKFIKTSLSEKGQSVFDITLKPYLFYSIINTVFMYLAAYNIGILNDDVFGGLFISWIVYSFIELFTLSKFELKE